MSYPTYVDLDLCLTCIAKLTIIKKIHVSHVIRVIEPKLCAINSRTKDIHNKTISKIEV